MNLSGERRVRWDGQVTYIFPWKDRLWGLNVYTRRVGEISAEGIAWQGQALDLGHWVKNLNQGGWLEEAASVFQEADRLCVAYNVSDMMGEIQFDYALLVVDLATGQARSVDTGLGQSVVPYKPGQALALGLGPAEDGYQYQLRGIDVVSGAVRDLHIGMPPYRSGATLAGLAYDRERDIIYYHDGSRAHLSQQSGAFTPGTVLPLGAVRGERPGLVLSDGRYGVEQEGLLLQAVSPGGAEGYLKLQLDFASASPTYRAYRKARPEAKVLLSEGRMTAAQVVTDMQGRTEPIDIYQLRVQSDFSAFKDKGYAAPLDDDAPLRQAVDAMYPFMREALQDQQGRLVAVPASIQIWHDAVAPENYALFFQGQPYPETWQEYLTQLYQFEEQSPGKSEYSFQEWMT